jgi:hypothetical protein
MVMDLDAGGIDGSKCGETQLYLYFPKRWKQNNLYIYRESYKIRSYVCLLP